MRSLDSLRQTPLSLRLIKKMRGANVPLPSADEFALFSMSPGHWQKSAGAWSWELFFKRNGEWFPAGIGSEDRATEIVRSDRKLGWYKCHGTIYVCADEVK